jgi:hypothetical protein
MSKKKSANKTQTQEPPITAPVAETPAEMQPVEPPSVAEVKMSEHAEIRAMFQTLVTQVHECKNNQEALKAELMKVAGLVNNL